MQVLTINTVEELATAYNSGAIFGWSNVNGNQRWERKQHWMTEKFEQLSRGAMIQIVSSFIFGSDRFTIGRQKWIDPKAPKMVDEYRSIVVEC